MKGADVMKTVKYKISGLDCASCAAKIEESSCKLEGVNNVTIDLMNNNVWLQADENSDDKHIFDEFNKIADRIEPGAKLVSEEIESEETEHSNILMRIIISIVFIAIGFMSNNDSISLTSFLISYFVVGYDVIILAFKNLIRGRALDENFLMSLATVGAFLINEHFEAVLVMLLYQIGEYLQHEAVHQSKQSITKLMNIKAEYAMKLVDHKEVMIDPENVMLDDVLVVRPGEKIPVDGMIISGLGAIDYKALTGESLPVEVNVDTEVLSGGINVDSVLHIRVTKTYNDSTIKQILDLVENASANKAPAEKFITRFAKYYTPIVVMLAVIIAFIVPLILEGKLYDYDYMYRALTFLVISCPCALVISVPLSFFGGIGGASKLGILFKGSNYIEALAKAEVVLFDKTGTLTEGSFNVVEVKSEYDAEQVIEYAAMAEYYSNHPIAKSIVNHYGKDIDFSSLAQGQELAHLGVGVLYNNKQVWAGNYKLMQEKNIDVKEVQTTESIVYVAVDNTFYGTIVIADKIKKDAAETISNLKQLGIKQIEMLTGDNKTIAQSVSETLALSNYHAGLTPLDKVDIVEAYEQNDERVIFVGDGINDAPVLTMASVGVAMGSLGSDAAIEAADVVIMDDNPIRLPYAIKQARRTMNIVKQNITFALATKFLFMALGAYGISNMAMAIFADVGVSLLAILNALRLLRVKQ